MRRLLSLSSLPVPVFSVLLLLLLVIASSSSSSMVQAARPRPAKLKRVNPTYTALSDASFADLAKLTDLDATLDWNDPSSWLAKLLVPRVPGSANLRNIQSQLVKLFVDKLGWHLEDDSFEMDTPIGLKPFRNLVFTHDPNATRRFVMSAHIDSKYFDHSPQDQFVGATDSAAPCAMLIDLALALTPWLDQRKKRIEDQGGEHGTTGQGETLQIIFFDGEEAFENWTHDDSIYGSRHLVDKWLKVSETQGPAHLLPSRPLDRISHLVLLDLLGAPKPVIRNFFTKTGWLYDEFLHAEARLGEAGHLWDTATGEAYTKAKSNPSARERSFFVARSNGNAFAGGIEDDHIPFLHNNVPVVHMIPMPFPPVWHTIKDDASALDLDTVKAWTLIIRLTVAEYLGLDPDASAVAGKGKSKPRSSTAKRKREDSDLVSHHYFRLRDAPSRLTDGADE